jgi:hypothetical protein
MVVVISLSLIIIIDYRFKGHTSIYRFIYICIYINIYIYKYVCIHMHINLYLDSPLHPHIFHLQYHLSSIHILFHHCDIIDYRFKGHVGYAHTLLAGTNS